MGYCSKATWSSSLPKIYVQMFWYFQPDAFGQRYCWLMCETEWLSILLTVCTVALSTTSWHSSQSNSSSANYIICRHRQLALLSPMIWSKHTFKSLVISQDMEGCFWGCEDLKRECLATQRGFKLQACASLLWRHYRPAVTSSNFSPHLRFRTCAQHECPLICQTSSRMSLRICQSWPWMVEWIFR